MHNGEYVGAAAAAQRKRILILGESHHGDGPEDVGKPGKIPTEDVVKIYLSQKDKTEKRLEFFHEIALSFGIETGKDEEKRLFWDKVFFGNYVDVLCGVRDSAARNWIKRCGKEYNEQLVKFVNERQIDIIFSFSILAYWALPTSGGCRPGILPAEQGALLNQKTVGRRNNRNVYLRGYICEPSTDTIDHPVTIYGIPHPSARGGFEPNHFVKDLKPVFEDCCG